MPPPPLGVLAPPKAAPRDPTTRVPSLTFEIEDTWWSLSTQGGGLEVHAARASRGPWRLVPPAEWPIWIHARAARLRDLVAQYETAATP